MKIAFVSVLVVAACGGPPAPRAPAEPAESTPPPAETGIYARLRQAPGPVPGLAGYTMTFVPDRQYCGGFRIETKHGPSSPSSDEAPLAELFAIEFPHDLDFSNDPSGSKARFDRWMSELQAVSGRAAAQYNKPGAGLEAMARGLQVRFRYASVLARAWIPTDVSTGDDAADKMQAYCDLVRPVAEAVLDGADRDAAVCADQAAKLAQHGWWDKLCKKGD